MMVRTTAESWSKILLPNFRPRSHPQRESADYLRGVISVAALHGFEP